MKQGPTDIIIADHRKIEKLFGQFDGATGAKRQEMASKIFDELELHTAMEEQIFYPAMEEEGDEEIKKITEEAYKEHGEAKEAIAELREMDPETEDFMEKMDVLKGSVTHHVQEEESRLLPMAEDVLSKDEAEELAEEMHALKTESK